VGDISWPSYAQVLACLAMSEHSGLYFTSNQHYAARLIFGAPELVERT
jgi:hypothetical protein